MKQKIIEELTGKKILILGFGREGRSTYNFIQKNKVVCELGIADKSQITDDAILGENIQIHTGSDYIDAVVNYDIVIKSPGISFREIDYDKIKNNVTSQTELFLKYASEKTIGVTGTKGKSTTSALIYKMLETKYNVVLVGNIGNPVFEEIEKYEDVDWYVYELSSHQLENIKYSPHISVLLNIYEEHLDHYNSYDEYKDAKRNIFKYQKETDYYIYNVDMRDVILNGYDIKQNVLNIDKSRLNLKTNLIGKHNEYNIKVAMAIAKLLKVDEESIAEVLASFKCLPHRLEYVGRYKNIHFVDDSIATIPEAAISAIESLDNISTIILGGMDRGIDYSNFINYLQNSDLDNIVLMNDSGKRIYNKLLKIDKKHNMFFVDNLEEAVVISYKYTKNDGVCLLSPAAASYGIFKNFEERGNKFKEYVIKYSK